MKVGSYYILVFIFSCFSQLILAQSDCNNLLDDATELYHSGKYSDCVELLEKGLKDCPLSAAKKEEAYILLINSNIEKDSIQAVDRNFKLLLLNNPAFRLKDYTGTDEFKSSYRDYYIFPRLAVGMRVHYRMADLRMDTANYIVKNLRYESAPKVKNRFNVSYLLDLRLNSAWAQFTELSYYAVSYEMVLKQKYFKQTIEENISMAQWDIGTKYYFNSYNKLNPYLTIGMSNQFITTARLDIFNNETLINPDEIYNPDETVAYSEAVAKTKATLRVDSKSMRRPYIPYIIAGSGILYKQGKFGYGIDLRYYIPLATINNPGSRFDEPNPVGDNKQKLIGDYRYIDNDFRLTRTDISFMIVYMIFNEAKKKSPKD